MQILLNRSRKMETLHLAACLLLLSVATISGVSITSREGLFLSNGTHILFSAKSNSLKSAVPVTQAQDRIVGLAVDVSQGIVFWSDIGVVKRGIWRGDMNGENSLLNQHRIVDADMFEVNGLTVDWISQHIYWTDGRKGTVEVANYNGSKRHILSIGGLQTPRGIVVDPEESFLYWNDQTSKKIERSRLDGSDRTTIVTLDSVHRLPNQMAIHDSKLYWVDAYSQELWRCDSDGLNAKKVAALKKETDDNPVFGLAITSSGQSIVSVWRVASIISVKVDGSDLSDSALSLLGSDPVFSLAYSDTSLQSTGSGACQSAHCSHLCLPKGETTFRCVCPSFGGLALATDNKNCRKPTNGMLLYALADEGIVGFVDPNGAPTTDRFLIGRSLRPVAVAYDPVHQVVYWSDVYEHTVHQANFDGSNHKIFLRSSTHAIGIVDGLSVDAKHGCLYYSNMGTTHINGTVYTWHRIETIKFDGTGLRTLVTRAEKPRALWVDSEHNHLYYTSWGPQASVVKTNLDGTDPRVILQNMDNPNGLAIGSGGKLYVVDSHDKTNRRMGTKKAGELFKSDIDGGNVAAVSGPELKVPFGLAVSSDKIYISDWERNEIISVGMSGSSETTVMSGVSAPMSLFFTPVTKSFASGACSSSDCKDICLVTPADGTTCACNSYKPMILQTDRKTCSVPNKFVLFADMGSIKIIGLDGTSDQAVYTLVQGNGYFSNFVALAYNPATKIVYYSGVDRGYIYSVPVDGSAKPSVFYKTGHVIDGLALDSNNSRLYWTDFTTGEIAYKELTGDNNSTVFVAADTARKPRGVVIHNGAIYWTEWGNNARVAKKDISIGSETTFQSSASGLSKINGLAISNNKMYIGDASGRIFQRDITSEGLKYLRYIPASHIYSLYAEDDFLWYTDWKKHSLSRVNLNTGRIEIIASGLMRPSQVIVHYDAPLTNCPTTNTCTATCSMTPGGYECSCPEGQMLKKDKAGCEKAVVVYVEVDPSHCVNVIPAVKRNEVCGQKIGTTEVKAVCKAGYGGSSCEACAVGHFKAGAGDEDCSACPQESETGSTACKCPGNKVWDWKNSQCSDSSPGACPNILMYDDGICTSNTCGSESDCGQLGQKCCPVVGCETSNNKRCVNPVALTECVYGGVIYQVDTTFSPNPCTKCRCGFDKTFGDHRYGDAVCSVTDCPALSCPAGKTVKPGQCCPVCSAPQSCPEVKTVTLTLDAESKCKLFAPKWAKKDEKRNFCWESSNEHEQSAEFIYPGYSEKCVVKVKVVDKLPPVLTCPEDKELYTSGDEKKINFASPAVNENVGIQEISRNNRGKSFAIGKTTVQFTAKDKAGNTATCSFTVTVTKQGAGFEKCNVPNPTHALFKCNKTLDCTLTCEMHYVRGPGSGNSDSFQCVAGTWTPELKDSFTNLACVLKKLSVVTSTVSLVLSVDVNQVVFLKASLQDYIRENYIIPSSYRKRIKQLIIIKGQDRHVRRARRATRDMDVTMELYIELGETENADGPKEELDDVTTKLETNLKKDIENNEVKLSADGNNDNVKVRSVTSTRPIVGCLPGEQKIETYCVVCPVGTFYDRKTKKCVLCAENWYQELEGQTQCRKCPTRTHSDRGSYVQAQCITDKNEPSSFPLMVVIGAAAGVVVLIIIIIVVIVVVCRSRSSSPDQELAPRGQAHTNEAYSMTPTKGSEESTYEDIPADHTPQHQNTEGEYLDLKEIKTDVNVYDKVVHT